MPVPQSPRRMDAVAADGVQTSFPFDFIVFSDEDVRVVLLDTTTSVETDAVLSAEYTVSRNPDQDSSPGGSVDFLVAPATGLTVTVVGGMANNQTTALPDGGAYRAEQVQTALDRLSIQIQQSAEAISRCAQVPVSGGDAALLNASINILSANLAALQTIVANIESLVALAPISGEIVAVAAIDAAVGTVAGISADVTAVVGNAGDISTVAAINAAVSAVAAINAAVSVVAGIAADVTTVAGIDTEVTTVAGVAADVTAVAADLPNLNIKVSRTSATGSAVLPAGPTADRDPVPEFGWTRANEDTGLLEFYNGTDWVPVGAGADGPAGNPFVYLADQVVNGAYVMPAGKNGFTPGPLTFGPAGSITVDGTSVFTIVT